MKSQIIAAALGLTACSVEDNPARVSAGPSPTVSGQSAPVSAPPATSAPDPLTGTKLIKPWDSSRCGDDDYKNAKMERHPNLMGMSSAQLVKAYGQASADEKVKIGEPIGSFYGPYRKLPIEKKQADFGEPIRILTWTKNKCNFSVFFKETQAASIAVYAFEWGVGADF
jgi:hypothetical protein